MAARKPRKPLTPEQRLAANERQRRYTIRKNAERYGVDVPAAAAKRREPSYRPPRKATRAQLGESKARTAARGGAARTAAERASAKATEARALRASVIEQFVQARNENENIFVSRPLKRKVAASADAATIRRRAAAEKIQAAGAALKRDFANQDAYAEARGRLSKREQRTFRNQLDRLAKADKQALAIYFHHEGGSQAFDVIMQGILYPVDGSPSDALKRLTLLADAVERGEQLYGTKVVGRLNI